MNDAAANPFGSNAVSARQAEALVAVEQSRAIAETQGAMIVAKKFPRDPIASMDRILNACSRPTLAEQALYTYSRGGTEITGPSIRLAEALAQNWGNMAFGIRELEQRSGESTVEAFAWDIETNTRQTKTFQVRHERHTKKGAYALTDPRDIYELTANQGARRLRACILGIIPGDVVEAAQRQCEVTLNTKAEVTPERLKSLLEKFAEFQITQPQIEARIQRRVDAMTPAQMVGLGKIFNSLKDGMSVPADWFEIAPLVDGADPGKTVTGPAALKEAAARRAAARKPNADDPTDRQEAELDKLDQADKTAATGPTVAEVGDLINKAKTADDIDGALSLIQSTWDDATRKSLIADADHRRAELTK
jgi:hypothetical protein